MTASAIPTSTFITPSGKPLAPGRQPGVLLYSRLSRRPGTDKVMTVAEQEKINEGHVERLEILGGVIGCFKDNGVSAFKRVDRPGYGELLAAIRKGVGTHVAFVATNRASRNVGRFADLLDACEDHDFWLIKDGNLKHPVDDRLELLLDVIVGENESREKGKAVKRAKLVSLERRTYSGGKTPFGFRKRPDARAGFWEQVPEQARAIRDAYAFVLDGGNLQQVSRDWNASGLHTPVSGSLWTFSHVRRTLLSPAVCGQRMSEGEVVGPLMLPDGKPWPAIVTLEERNELEAVLRARYPSAERWHTAAPGLLSGIVVCSQCGHRMNICRYRSGRKQPAYRCSRDGGDRCGKTSILASKVDDDLTAAALDLLQSPAFRKKLAEPKTKKVKRSGPDPATIQADIDVLNEARIAHEISMPNYLKQLRALEAELKAAQKVEEVDDRSRVLRPFMEGDPVAAWKDADFEQKRLALAALFAKVEIGPAAPGKGIYDSRRVTPYRTG